MARVKKLVDAKQQPAKSPEEKSAAFQKLANKRVNKALKAMQQIAYLSNLNAYYYTQEETQKILDALSNSLSNIKASFLDPKAARGGGFSL